MSPGSRVGWGSNPSSEKLLGLSEPQSPPGSHDCTGSHGASWCHQVTTQVGAAAMSGAGCAVVNVALPGLQRTEEAGQGCPGQHRPLW